MSHQRNSRLPQPPSQPKGSTRYHWIFVCVLLVAALLRFASFGESPPGLQHDEMFKALEGRRLLETGDFRVFYPTNQGHEGGYVWALAASMALVGVNALAVRLPAFIFGMLSVALVIRFTGRLLNRRAAAFAGGLYAVGFFALFTSRVGLRAGLLPVFVLWLLLSLHSLLKQGRRRDVVGAGFALGLATYTYTSAFALWGGLLGLALLLVFFDRRALRDRGLQIVLAGVLALVVSLPMIVARVTDPEGFNRSSTITRPLIDALAGQPHELLDNAVRLLGMGAFTGDPEARYNLPGRPLFPAGVGLLAYAGLAVAAARIRRQPIYAAVLGIMIVGLVPSLLTVSAPSFLRSIVLLPALTICVAAAVDRLPGRVSIVAGSAILVIVGVSDGRAYFVDWPQQAGVKAIYRDDLEQLADAVSNSDGKWLVSTPDVELDALTFSLYAGADIQRVAFFDGDTTLAFMAGEFLAISGLAPLTTPHSSLVAAQAGDSSSLQGQDGETVYWVSKTALSVEGQTRLDSSAEQGAYLWADGDFERGDLEMWATSVGYPINFGNQVQLIGVELPNRAIAREYDGVNLQLFMQPLVERSDQPLSVFVHVYRANNGRLHAQRDLMGMPPSQWMQGVTLVQDNFVVMGPSRPGWYIVAMGFYNVDTGVRLPILGVDGASMGDRLLLGRVRVEE